MYLFLLTLLVLDAMLLVAVVLLQAGKGGGLAAMGAAGAGGSDTLFGSRQAATLLTNATWWAGGIFLVLAFILSMMSGTTRGSESILRGVGTAAPPASTSPALPAVTPAPAGDPDAVPGEQAAPQTLPPSDE